MLTRDQPVEITLVNELGEDTAIHWHGMELESYYDGVHGWGRTGTRVTPMIESGGRFVVRFTPPRSGTFMYHTHVHDRRQLTSGLYGAMIVVDPGATYDERTDHALPLTKDGAPAPADRRAAVPARQVIGVGETYDFEFVAPKGRHTLWLEGRPSGGRWLVQAQVIVK